MNVNSMNGRLPEDSGAQNASVAGKSSGRQAVSIMDLGKPDEGHAATTFRRHFDEVVKANAGASRGRNSLHEHSRSNQSERPDREVIDRVEHSPQTLTQGADNEGAPQNRQAPVDNEGNSSQATARPDHRQEEQSEARDARSDSREQSENIQVNDTAGSPRTDDLPQDPIAQALAGLAAVQVTAPVSPVQAPPQPDAADQVAPTVSPASQAADILTSAIVSVSEALGMKVSDGVYHLDLKQPGESDAQEIGDILSSLKAISSILDNAATSGEPIEIKGSLLQGKEISQLDDLLHQAVFKIEAAANILGISQSVSSAVAQNSGMPGMQGIAVAVDPADKSMPSVYVDRVSAMSASDSHQTIQGLIERLTSLLRDAGNQDSSAATMSFAQRVLAGGQSTQTMLNQVRPLDTSVMRVILKVDGAQASAAENQKAANQSEKMDLPKTLNLVMGRDLLDGAGAMQSTDNTQDGSAAVKLLDLSALQSNNASSTVRVVPMPERVDQSVVTQLVQNFSSMLKIGSHEVKIMLHPRELGDVHLSVKINGDEVVAKIQVESQQVKQIVESNLQSLKSTLAEHNLKSTSFSVEVNTGAGRDLADQGASHADNHENNHVSTGPVDGVAAVPGDHGSVSEGAGGVGYGHDTGRRYGSNSFEFYA